MPATATTSAYTLRARLQDAVAAGRFAVGETSPGPSDRQRGVALLLAMTAIAILSIFSLEFTYQSRVAVRTSSYVEHEVEASLHARSAIELAALVIGSVDIVESILNKYASMLGGRKPNISTASYACEFVNAFCKGRMNLMGIPLIDLTGHEAAGLERGTCGCRSSDEDGRVNINRVGNLAEKQTVFDTLYKVLERTQGNPRPNELDKDMAQLALNIIDWSDKDNLKTDINPSTRRLVQGTGAEGVAYAKNGYKSKDAAFDTTQEVRLVDGVTDRMWCSLRKQLTVYNTSKINVNSAPIEVLKALICKNLADPRTEAIACAISQPGQVWTPVDAAAQYMQVCRTLKKLIFSPPFASTGRFVRFFDKLPGVLPPEYAQLVRINRGKMLRDISTKGKIIRISAYGTSGPVTKTITAALDTNAKQWVYWRED
jgi:type II secretory pathway component PulK